jgi:5-formyltetrahydrofolate cyclo-ligase
LIRRLCADGVACALPVVVGKGRPMIFRAWSLGTKMAARVWDIPVPAEGVPVSPDLLLVPFVGFDRRRYRLGYGGGFYDRTLAAADPRPRTIGIGFASCEVPTIHPQPHDIPLDTIVTECGELGA